VSGRWQLVGPSLQGSLARATTRVLRLDTSGTTTTALVAEASDQRTGLLGLWRSAAGAWTRTRPLVLGRRRRWSPAQSVRPDRKWFSSRTAIWGISLDETAGPDDAWVELPSPPAGTAAVAPLAGGGINAFSVAGERLRVYTLTPSGKHVGALTADERPDRLRYFVVMRLASPVQPGRTTRHAVLVTLRRAVETPDALPDRELELRSVRHRGGPGRGPQ